MVLGEIHIKQNAVTLRTQGLGALLRHFEQAGADTQDMKDLMHAIGSMVVEDAKKRVPRKDEKLVKTLRAGRGKTKAVVRAGSKAIKYAGIIHYGTFNGYTDAGGRVMKIKPTLYLTEALTAQQEKSIEMLEQGIKQIMLKNDIRLK